MPCTVACYTARYTKRSRQGTRTVNASVESYRRRKELRIDITNEAALFSFKFANKRQFRSWRGRVFRLLFIYIRVYVYVYIYIHGASRTGYQLYAQFGTNEPQRRNSHKPFGENSNATRLSEQFTSSSRGHAMRYSFSRLDSRIDNRASQPSVRPRPRAALDRIRALPSLPRVSLPQNENV